MENCENTVKKSPKLTTGVEIPKTTASDWGCTSPDILLDTVEMVDFDAKLVTVNNKLTNEEESQVKAETQTMGNR